ncbi:hypothetical protein HPP92_024158 [Vanilla planifolia]|uniref:Chaperone DnaJ C-terminal domain-containing protein n=1 Tax=Vanilla planifolia TaxID=51239 RepID=A0A835PJ59_VANPL|nr:hypothetical protein HPP92_024158 [Vanilla planifolia]
MLVKMMPMEDIMMIDINPGWKDGTKISYPKKVPAYVIVVEEKSHEMFTREGNDLITTQKISLAQAQGLHGSPEEARRRTLAIPITP